VVSGGCFGSLSNKDTKPTRPAGANEAWGSLGDKGKRNGAEAVSGWFCIFVSIYLRN